MAVLIPCRAPRCLEPVAAAHDVCAVCWDYRHHWRNELLELWLRAESALVPGRSGLDVKVRMSKPGSSMPLRMAPMAAMYEALVRVQVWADTLIRRGCRGSMPESGRDSFLFARAVLLLDLHDHTLADTSLAGDYYTDLYRAYWRLYRVDRVGVELVRVDGRCPVCERRSLWERHAGEYVQCLTCGTLWTQASWMKIAAHRSVV